MFIDRTLDLIIPISIFLVLLFVALFWDRVQTWLGKRREHAKAERNRKGTA